MNKSFFQKHAQVIKKLLIAFFILAACCLTYYFHAVLRVGTIVSHFYYIPIILACIWYQKKGIWIAVFLVTFLLASHQLLKPAASTYTLYIRIFMLMTIAIVVAALSERISATERQLRNAHDQLEKRVVERTAQLAEVNRKLELEIEQHKRSEERLALSAKRLEQRNEEIKNFAYIVSHDLRAPLVNLKGFSAELRIALDVIRPVLQTLITQPDRQLQPAVSTALLDIAEALDFIGSSTNRMDSLINALLQLSRLGRSELKREPIDMEKMVQETLNALAHQIAEKQIDVKIGPLPKIEADRLAMQQILGNLLNNAVLYSLPERKSRIEITAETGLDQVTIFVKDNGRGIAPKDMDKVFVPFRSKSISATIPTPSLATAFVRNAPENSTGIFWKRYRSRIIEKRCGPLRTY